MNDIVEFLKHIDEEDPRKRVEIVCVWIKRQWQDQIEDSLNLIKEGVTSTWLLASLTQSSYETAHDIIQEFNDYDEEVFITRLEIKTDELDKNIRNDEHLIELIESGELMPMVRTKTEVGADYVFKE